MGIEQERRREWTVRSGDDFGRAIAGVRETRGLTQRELAGLAGVGVSYLAKLEAAVVTPIVLDRITRMLRRMGATITISVARDDAAPH